MDASSFQIDMLDFEAFVSTSVECEKPVWLPGLTQKPAFLPQKCKQISQACVNKSPRVHHDNDAELDKYHLRVSAHILGYSDSELR